MLCIHCHKISIEIVLYSNCHLTKGIEILLYFQRIRIDFQSFKPSLLFCCDSKLSGSQVQMITNFPQSWPFQAFHWYSPISQRRALNSSLLNRILGSSLYDARQHRILEQKWLYAGADSLSLVDARKLNGSLLLLCAHAQPCGRETKPV